ncbi:maleylpyruvate isomerase family mycothiol-dependent enzyme [Calidifontibacter terrae]
MSTLAAGTIDALRHEHDTLTDLVTALSDEQLNGPSGATDWTIAQVLSHLGSGSEISLASLHAALGEGEAPADDFNRSVWDRWDAMSPADQRSGFLDHNARLVAALEALTPEQHDSVSVPIGFLPAPVSVATYAGLRLNEVAHHSWDVRVGLDHSAGLLGTSTPVLLEQFSGDLGVLLGFVGKADLLSEPVVLAVADSGYGLAIDDSVKLVTPVDGPTAAFEGPAEAALRLISGRLRSEYTPAEVSVTGNVTLDELRTVFPGF